MKRPNLRILSAQGILLLGCLLSFGSWDLQATAAPNSGPGAPVSSTTPGNSTGTSSQMACQSFQCSGERCYQEEVHGNRTEPCHNASHCELYRLNSTSYTARCSSGCRKANITELCVNQGGPRQDLCILECCSSPSCLQLNATAYGDRRLTTAASTTTTTATTTRMKPRHNGKVCSSFTCHGEGCFKGQKSSASCTVGFDFCEMKKTGPHFVAACSKACKSSGPACKAGSTAPCFQECCPATPKSSCLKLDGKVHFNGVRGLAPPPLLQLLGWAVVLSLGGAIGFQLGPGEFAAAL